MAKQKYHVEHFHETSIKKCDCEEKGKRSKGNLVYGWHHYQNAKKHLIKHFCKECFERRVKSVLKGHIKECGCNVSISFRGCVTNNQPEWMQLSEEE